MKTAGAQLRLERERQKLDLKKIADDTRISHRYLEAIEADDMSALPGDFFYKAFIRQYGRYLGMNTDELERQITGDLAPAAAAPAPTLSGYAATEAAKAAAEEDRQIKLLRESLKGKPLRPPQDDGMSKRWLAFAAVIILGCIGYFSWPTIQERLLAPKKQVEVASTPAPAPPPVTPAPVQTQPVTQDPTPAPTEPAPQPTQTAPPIAAANAATTPPAATSGQFSLTVQAKSITWIRLTADGNKVYGGTIEAGETKTVNAKFVELIVGNAGTLDVIYNGKPIQFGTKGEVKTLLITPEGWKYKPKAPPAEPTPSTSGTSTPGGPGSAPRSPSPVAL